MSFPIFTRSLSLRGGAGLFLNIGVRASVMDITLASWS
jgi:hypothetical protein